MRYSTQKPMEKNTSTRVTVVGERSFKQIQDGGNFPIR